jgi:phage terminase large subunit
MPEIRLPNNWTPRPDQMPLWRYLENGGTRACEIAHRRWGKDDVALHRTAVSAFERVGGYWHCLPLYEQSRKAIWAAVNPVTGKRRIDEAFPLELRETTREQEMFIRFKNGSTWQVVGSDNFNTLVGAGTVGITFSEWALANPQAWSYFRPMLKQNKGWALFITTPRGRNHALNTYEMAKASMDAGTGWFAQKLTAYDTPVFTREELEDERQEYINGELGPDDGEQMFRQEYLCSFDAPLVGSFYGRILSQAEDEDRICRVPHNPDLGVIVSFDIGRYDDTAIWFFQQYRNETRVIDYYDASGFGPDHYAQVMQEKKYNYSLVIMPHDAENKTWVTDQTPAQSMRRYGYKVTVLPKSEVMHGINAGRALAKMCIWDEQKCARGLEKLRAYKREWDDKNKCFKPNPAHNHASHCFTGETEVLTRNGMCQIKNLPKTGEVLTSWGWKPYQNPRVTRRNAPVVMVKFMDGLSVKCTPDHLFKTIGGWKSAESLTPGIEILSGLMSEANRSTVGLIADMGTASISKAMAGFIDMLGLPLLARFPQSATSITSTATLPIMRWPISNASPQMSTCRKLGSIITKGAILASWQDSGPLSGIGQTLGANGTDKMRSAVKAGGDGTGSLCNASIAESLSRASSALLKLIRRNTATRIARQLLLESVEETSETHDVWCLTVPGAGEFALSNGAIVHNCADSWRYAALGLPRQDWVAPESLRYQQRAAPTRPGTWV